MDVLTENIEKDPPWATMFVDDLVLCTMTLEEVEKDLETWRVVFERHRLKISKTKIDYLSSPTNCLLYRPTLGHCSRVREVHRLMSAMG